MLVKLSNTRGLFKSALGAGIAFFALTGAATIAQAITLNDTVTITVYQGTNPGNAIGDAMEQANKLNPLLSTTAIGTGTYTGNIDFIEPTGGSNNINDFLLSAPGSKTLTGTLASLSGFQLSTTGFKVTTLFVITGSTANILTGTIHHDDGSSLYDGPGYTNTVFDAAGPVVDTPTGYSGLTGTWELLYVEANDLPARLTFDVSRSEAPPTTPIPGALPLFASGLGALGLLGWRRKRKAAAIAA